MTKVSEKCIFQPLHNDTKSVLSIKESYSMKKRPKIFTNAFGQAGGGTSPPPPFGQPDRKKTVLVFDDFPYPLTKKTCGREYLDVGFMATMVPECSGVFKYDIIWTSSFSGLCSV